LKFLDCFCGLGGASEGFFKEGFECTGIEINPEIAKMYPYKVIIVDMLELDGKDFKDYDVIWGSPPCRDFSPLGIVYGKSWKIKRNPQKGLELVNYFLKFVEDAKPRIWIMENVEAAKNYIPIEPECIVYLQRRKKHCFWGNFPPFLMPKTNTVIRGKTFTGRDTPIWKNRKLASWLSAKIPLPCSLAFAQACKQKLLEKEAST